MASELRRERREKQKRQRRQQSRRREGGGLSSQLVVGGVVAAAIVLGILGLRAAGVFEPPAAAIDLNSAAFQVPAGTQIGTQEPLQDPVHIPVGQKASYNTVPPTSGQHWNQAGVAPAPWGIKDANLPNEVTTHNLEHGGIVIMYGPDVSSDQVNTLRLYVRQLQASGFPKIVLEPWPDMPKDSKVILTAWNWVMKLPGIDQISIVKFTKAHHASSEAPEPSVP